MQDICTNLETAYNNHRIFKQSHQHFVEWLKETQHHIRIVQDDRGSKDGVTARLVSLDVSH